MRGVVPSAGAGSRQGQEKYFELAFGHRFLTFCAVPCDAFPEPSGDDLESGTVEGAGDGGELSDYVFAVAALFDHRDYAGELPLSATQPIQHRSDSFFVSNH